MPSDGTLRRVSAALFLCLIAAGVATVAGVANAGLAGATLVALAAVLVGTAHATDGATRTQVVGGVVLAAAGVVGVAVGLGGENPLGRWPVLVPMAVGLVLASAGDEETAVPLVGWLLAEDAE